MFLPWLGVGGTWLVFTLKGICNPHVTHPPRAEGLPASLLVLFAFLLSGYICTAELTEVNRCTLLKFSFLRNV